MKARFFTPVLVAIGALLTLAGPAEAQTRTLRIAGGDEVVRLPAGSDEGFAAVPATALERLGWTLRDDGHRVRATRDGASLVLTPGNPFFRWEGALYQLADAPYRTRSGMAVPRQLLSDFLPAVLGATYRYEPDSGVLRVAGELTAVDAPGADPDSRGNPAPPEPATTRHSRLVVVDPGHGGKDPGTVGRRGTREKDVALAIGLALAEELRKDSTLDVRLTREEDVLVPLWRRGELATEAKDGRPSVFISLHANAVKRRRTTRGFETYFLSDARTEHERRVAALENSAVEFEERPTGPAGEDPDIAFILKELRNHDHAHWSRLLAQEIQEALGPVHPGPNRGVKQSPLAVLTNALMPAVLVEVGFVSNRSDESLLVRSSFQRDAAGAIASAVRDFFRRYPPGPGVAVGAR